MDITSVRSFRAATSREDLRLAPGETFIAGGTWLMSEPQPETTGFVDVMTLGWPAIEVSDEILRISATCTIGHLVSWAADAQATHPHWRALSLVPEAANALLASFKIWNTATVGGNVCRSFAAAGMVSFAVALDAHAVIWGVDGKERREPVSDIITGNGTNSLARGELLRAIEVPDAALRATAQLRKIALAEHGRSGAVLTGRVDESGGAVFTVTAATLTPLVLRFAALPSAHELAELVEAAPNFYTDPLGSADWRRGVSVALSESIRSQLAVNA